MYLYFLGLTAGLTACIVLSNQYPNNLFVLALVMVAYIVLLTFAYVAAFPDKKE